MTRPAPWTQLRPSQPPKPRRRLRPMSPKRARESVVYERLKAAHFALHPDCQLCGGPISWDDDRTCHHWAGRAGKLYLYAPWFRTAHLHCHQFVDQHPREAVALGWRAPEGVYNNPRAIKKVENSSCGQSHIMQK